MEKWEVVQRNKETGEEKTFYSDGASKKLAEMAADLRTKIVSAKSDKYEVFIRQIPDVT